MKSFRCEAFIHHRAGEWSSEFCHAAATPVHLDTATVRKRMGVVALAVPSQLGAASPSAGDSRRYNGDSIKMHPRNARFPIEQLCATLGVEFVVSSRTHEIGRASCRER